MNGRYYYLCPDTDSGNGIGENGEYENNDAELPEDNVSSNDSSVNVSDSVGSDSDIITDTESDSGNIENSAVDNTESGMETKEEFSADYTESDRVDYTPELEYIDYLLSTQIQNQLAVQSVSGNSVVVTFDDAGTQMLTEIRDNQIVTHEKCDMMINLVGCLLLAVVAEYLIMSSKRVMKRMVNRKE